MNSMMRILRKLPRKGSVDARAEVLGRAEFKAGKPRVPARSVKLMALLRKTKEIDRGLEGWIRGWDEANLAAPVPGWTREENLAIRNAQNAYAPFVQVRRQR